jgi:hypothetical protein
VFSVGRIRASKAHKKYKIVFNYLNLWWTKIFLGRFSLKVLDKVPLCEKIKHKKSYPIILNGNQDIGDESFLVFLTVCTYLTFLVDIDLTVNSLVFSLIVF